MCNDNLNYIVLKFADGDDLTLHKGELQKFEMYGINLNMLWNDGQPSLFHSCVNFEVKVDRDLVAEATNRDTLHRHMALVRDKFATSVVEAISVQFRSGIDMHVVVLGNGEDLGYSQIEENVFTHRCAETAK